MQKAFIALLRPLQYMIQKVGRGLMDRSNLEQLMCTKLEYFEAVYQVSIERIEKKSSSCHLKVL